MKDVVVSQNSFQYKSDENEKNMHRIIVAECFVNYKLLCLCDITMVVMLPRLYHNPVSTSKILRSKFAIYIQVTVGSLIETSHFLDYVN